MMPAVVHEEDNNVDGGRKLGLRKLERDKGGCGIMEQMGTD